MKFMVFCGLLTLQIAFSQDALTLKNPVPTHPSMGPHGETIYAPQP